MELIRMQDRQISLTLILTVSQLIKAHSSRIKIVILQHRILISNLELLKWQILSSLKSPISPLNHQPKIFSGRWLLVHNRLILLHNLHYSSNSSNNKLPLRMQGMKARLNKRIKMLNNSLLILPHHHLG